MDWSSAFLCLLSPRKPKKRLKPTEFKVLSSEENNLRGEHEHAKAHSKEAGALSF